MAKERVQIDKVKNKILEPYVVEFATAYSRHPEIVSPMIAAAATKDLAGSNLGIGWAYCDKPLVMIEKAHTHEFDQFLFFISGDSSNFLEFDAEIELGLDNKTKHITTASYVFVPKGMFHCPLIVKRVTKPFVFIDARLTKEASVRPA
jgi:hypothetical protein